MTLVWTVAWAVAWVGAALLLMAGTAKVARPVASTEALTLAGFPASSRVARGLGVGEVVLGALVLGAATLPTPLPTLVVAGVGLAYLAFAVVAARLLAAGASSCGCFGEVDAPLSRLHVAVDAALAAAGVVAATGAPPTVGGLLPTALVVVVVAAAAWMLRALLVQVPALADGVRRLEAA